MSNLISQNLNMIFKTPKGETVHALKDLNFTIKKGELLTVLGPSGCGKTTLLNITAGFIRPTSGKITLNNKEINEKDLSDLLEGIDKILGNDSATVFEILTCAFIKYAEYFKDNINIIEAGLFHRFDSTNVFKQNLLTLLGVIHLDLSLIHI